MKVISIMSLIVALFMYIPLFIVFNWTLGILTILGFILFYLIVFIMAYGAAVKGHQ